MSLLQTCFSPTTMHLFGPNPLISSALVMGSTDMMVQYVSTMSSVLKGDFPACEAPGVDQVVHKVIHYFDTLNGSTFRHHEDSYPVVDLTTHPEFRSADGGGISAILGSLLRAVSGKGSKWEQGKAWKGVGLRGGARRQHALSEYQVPF